MSPLSGYYGMTAQRSAMNRRARRRKLARFGDLWQHVIAQLKVWPSLTVVNSDCRATGSPEQIAGRLQLNGQSLRVSHETIYAYVYSSND